MYKISNLWQNITMSEKTTCVLKKYKPPVNSNSLSLSFIEESYQIYIFSPMHIFYWGKSVRTETPYAFYL